MCSFRFGTFLINISAFMIFSEQDAVVTKTQLEGDKKNTNSFSEQNKAILVVHVSFSGANLEAIYVSPAPLEQRVNTQISGFLVSTMNYANSILRKAVVSHFAYMRSQCDTQFSKVINSNVDHLFEHSFMQDNKVF